MKALILNSGAGRRLGCGEKGYPKCMTRLSGGETILERQIRILAAAGIDEIVLTTGLFHSKLTGYVTALNPGCSVKYVYNPLYAETNYIYSICLAHDLLDGDLLLLHGDLVFERVVVEEILMQKDSSVVISSTCPLPEKDFKARMMGERIMEIGVDIFRDAVSLQPLYKMERSTWKIWLSEIMEFCNRGERDCYAEDAFNQAAGRCVLYGFDIKDYLCSEIDCEEDLRAVNTMLERC